MCFTCYIGINSEIDEVKWVKNIQTICIKKIDRSIFHKDTFINKNIYCIGTRESCGCNFGFIKIPDKIINDVRLYFPNTKQIKKEHTEYFEYEVSLELIENTIKQNAEYSEDTQNLYSIIIEQAKINDIVEFFGCWAGLEDKVPNEITEVDTRDKVINIDFGKIWDINIKINFVQKN
jgi:hypothetical protein